MGIGTFEEFAELQVVAKSAEEGRLKQSLDHALKLLEKDPLHAGALTLASYCLRRLGAHVQAYLFARTGAQEFPDEAALWVNLGGAAQGLWLPQEAETAYKKALKLIKNPKHAEIIYLNLGALAIDCGEFDKGEQWIRKLLELRPTDKNTLGNLGFCYLARRDWVEGWKLYAHCVGSDWLPKVQYRDEGQWNGQANQTVAVYEDQGVGDAISFASCLPDAARVSKRLIFDCDAKLYGLFKRSFPQVQVYPTRRENGSSGALWAKEDRQIDASIPLSQLPGFFRLKDEDFPGTAYLTPCPIRGAMWGEYFRSLKRPVIGVAWSGGVAHTNARYRQLTLEELLPVFESVPEAHWVSLQYKDAAAEIEAFKAKHDIDLVQYRFGTLTPDYDDTAALVANLDSVVCMQTAVGHLAGALGKDVCVLVPTHTTWRYAIGESLPWYHSMKILRQERDWTHALDRAAAHLRELSGRAGATARRDELRANGAVLRSDRSRDHSTNGRHPSS